MKNLKRALSLALSSVMLLGMMVVGTGAAGYDDVTAEHNVEAIEVLEAMGVMEGTGNGFNPDAKVTRQEMAVIMCNVLDLTVSSYKGTTSFTDVDTWALPYVEACYTNGIISGYSATEFGAKDSLTTGQAALMLMKALGYFQESGDFGQDWLVATTKQGALIDLFSGVDTGAKEALTRNDVAQMALNALKSDMVKIYQYDVVADGKGGFTTKANYNSRDNKDGIDYTVDNGPGHQDATLQLIEELYGNTFKLNKGEKDDFGRPASKWSNKLDPIGTYTSTPTASYTTGVALGTMYDLLGTSVRNGLTKASATETLTFYVDGVKQLDGADADDAVDQANLGQLFAKNNKISIANTGNGALTEVFVKTDGNVVVTVTNTYLVEAAGDYNTLKGEARFAQYEDATYPTLNAGQNVLSSDDWKGLEEIEDGDFLLITVASGDVMSIAFAQTVEGVVNTYTKNHASTDGKTITLAGTKYSYAATAGGQDDLDFTVGQEASLILDQYGYAIGVAETMINRNFAYVLDAKNVAGLMGSEVKAVVAYTDGTIETVTVNKIGNDAANSKTNAWLLANVADEWFNFAKTSTGALNLMTVTNYTSTKCDETDVAVTADMTLMDGKSVDPFSSGLLFNSKTTLVVVDPAMDATVYVGAETMPTIKSTTATVSGSEEYTIELLVKDGYVYFAIVNLASASGANDVKDFQIIDENAKAEFLFLLEMDSEHWVENGVKYYTYETLKADGTVEKITFDATGAEALENLIYRPNYNKDGYVVDGVIVDDDMPAYFNLHTIAGGVADQSAGTAYSATERFGVKYNNNTLSFYDAVADTAIAGGDFITTKDTQIFLILDDSSNLTKYTGVLYEVNDVKAATVANVLDGKKFSGRIAGKTVTDTSNVLETLYIYVDTVANI